MAVTVSWCKPLLVAWALPVALVAAAPPVPAADTIPPAPAVDSSAALPASRETLAVGADSVASVPDSILQSLSRRALESGAAAAETASVSAPPPSAAVVIGGATVFRVRTGVGTLDPSQRAALIRQRVTRAVTDREVSPDSVRLVASAEGIEVRVGPHLLWVVRPGDLDAPDPGTLGVYLAALPGAVRDGLVRERQARTPMRLVLSVLAALALTLVAWLLVRVLRAAALRWRGWLVERLIPRVPALRFRTFEVVSQAQISRLLTVATGYLDVPLALFIGYVWLTTVLSLFPWTHGWGALLTSFAVARVLDVFRIIGESLPGLLAVAIVLGVFRLVVQVSDRFFDAVDAGTLHVPGFHRELARPSRRLMRVVLWLVAIMVAYPYIPGAQTRAFQGVSILLGVMVSLGSTGVVGNAIAGLVLTYSRAFSMGDRVKIGEHVGDVVNLGFFATRLRSPWNEEVVIPNGQVASNAMVNFTRMGAAEGLALHTQVTIGYDVPWRQVHALLAEAASRVEGVEPEPAPYVLQRALGDFSVSYELVCRTRRPAEQLRLYSDLHAAIQDAFARAGVEILSPAYHALRDAHAAALPAEPAGPRGEPGAFRVRREAAP